jgi:hypothetical protein
MKHLLILKNYCCQYQLTSPECLGWFSVGIFPPGPVLPGLTGICPIESIPALGVPWTTLQLSGNQKEKTINLFL